MARDFSSVTPCGETCVGCAKRVDGFCMGCRETDGQCKEWEGSGGCPIYKCAVNHGVLFCGLCNTFPCTWLVSKVTWNKNIVEELTELAIEYKLSKEPFIDK